MPSDSQMCLGLSCSMVSDIVKQWRAEVQKHRSEDWMIILLIFNLLSPQIGWRQTVNSLPWLSPLVDASSRKHANGMCEEWAPPPAFTNSPEAPVWHQSYQQAEWSPLQCMLIWLANCKEPFTGNCIKYNAISHLSDTPISSTPHPLIL